MNDLIEALQIFAKYNNDYAPTHCEHDVLYVAVNPYIVGCPDIERLQDLGFVRDYTTDMFKSYRFGSC